MSWFIHRFILLDTHYFLHTNSTTQKKKLSICFRLYTLVSISLAMLLCECVCLQCVYATLIQQCVSFIFRGFIAHIYNKRASFDLHIVATMEMSRAKSNVSHLCVFFAFYSKESSNKFKIRIS